MRSRIVALIRWVGGHELQVLVGVIVVVAGTWGFIELAGEVVEGDTQALDERIVLSMRRADPNAPDAARGIPVGPSWLPNFMRDITSLGGYAVLSIVTTAVVVFLCLDQKFAAAGFTLAAIVGGYLISMGLKALFARPRPSVVEHLHDVASASFPSGHSMMSAVVYLTLGTLLMATVKSRRLKFYFLALALFLTAIVGASRVYLGVHYPTDVLAGWTAGLVWATACWLLAKRLQRKGTIEDET